MIRVIVGLILSITLIKEIFSGEMSVPGILLSLLVINMLYGSALKSKEKKQLREEQLKFYQSQNQNKKIDE